MKIYEVRVRATQLNISLMKEMSSPIQAFSFDEAYSIFKYRILISTGWELDTPVTKNHIRVKGLFKSPKVNSFGDLEALECTIQELRKQSEEECENFLTGKVFEYERKNFSVTFIYKGFIDPVSCEVVGSKVKKEATRTYAF